MTTRIDITRVSAATKRRLTRQLDEFDSETEREWNKLGKVLLATHLQCPLMVWQRHHPFTLHLIGESYSPDFMYVSDAGDILVVEVKGSRRQKNFRDSQSKLRSAAKMFPMFRFFLALKTKERGWIIEEIT